MKIPGTPYGICGKKILMSGWPKDIHQLITETFGNPSKKAYGQISSVDAKGIPSVRTVHIHSVENPAQALVISCNTKSQKWSDLTKNSNVAGCFWDLESMTQYRFQGIADLITKKNIDFSDMIDQMWMSMREEVRVTYLLDEKKLPLDIKKPDVDPKQHSKNHGLILIIPNQWDIFHNNPKAYRLGKRTIYKLKNNKWSSKNVNSLHEK